MCTPSPRWTPAHDRQMKTPNLGEAHCGLGAPQSQQLLLLLVLWIVRSCSQSKGTKCQLPVVFGFTESWLEHPMGPGESHVHSSRARLLAKSIGNLLTLDLVSGSTSHMAFDAILGKMFLAVPQAQACRQRGAGCWKTIAARTRKWFLKRSVTNFGAHREIVLARGKWSCVDPLGEC